MGLLKLTVKKDSIMFSSLGSTKAYAAIKVNYFNTYMREYEYLPLSMIYDAFYMAKTPYPKLVGFLNTELSLYDVIENSDDYTILIVYEKESTINDYAKLLHNRRHKNVEI